MRQQSEPFGGFFDLFNSQTPIEKTWNPNYTTYAADMEKDQTRRIDKYPQRLVLNDHYTLILDKYRTMVI